MSSFIVPYHKYRNCIYNGGKNIPFNDASVISAFNYDIEHNYISALNRMIELTEEYILTDVIGRMNWLVKALLEMIETDNDIADDDLFYIHSNGSAATKAEIKGCSDFELQAFLLGVLHYVIIHRTENKKGQATYNSWYPNREGHSEGVFNSAVGNRITRDINIYNLVRAKSLQIDSTDFLEEFSADLTPNIAPELTENPPYVIIPAEAFDKEEEFSLYLRETYNKYSNVKTLLYIDRPVPFYDIYVCNDIHQKVYVSRATYQTKVISNATAKILSDCSNFIIISGTGGLGKSMMMRHLLLDAINNFDSLGCIPIFIPLKDFKPEYSNLEEFIHENFNSLGADKTIDEFRELLSLGKCLLLFDGLDEINTSYRERFEHELELFTDKYVKNMFIISSRPYGSFVSFSRFTVLELSPFSKQQALDLIDKLDFREDEPAIKANFRKQLDEKLYLSHRTFIENPLLLTIMLMTFEQFAEIPSKMHIFYHEAYVALSQRHDATKGSYKRALKTGLTADRFADYFAEFCARTYRDQKFELTEDEFDTYFKKLNEHKKDYSCIMTSDFLYDVTANMCLMYYESQRYHFTHRSFQEYFCALYFSKQKDKNLKAIGDFFESKNGRNYGDITFNMLYDMIPEKVEEYIFCPFLTGLIQKCKDNDGYWTFLQIIYPHIAYENGETSDSIENEPSSFIYSFIVNEKCLYELIESDVFPFYDEFVTEEFVYISEKWCYSDGEIMSGLMVKDDVDTDYFYEYGEPDTVGYTLEFNISDIVESPNRYSDLINILNNNDFPLKREYHNIQKYLEELKREQEVKGTDLFDLF